MGITELTVRLLLLFFPGVICLFIVEALIVHRERKAHELFIFSYVYGLLSYFVYAVLHAIFAGITGAHFSTSETGIVIPLPESIRFSKSLTDASTGIDFLEIGLVTVVAVAVGIGLAYAINHKWLHKLAQHIGVSRKFGDPDVWSFALNSQEIRWANVRDLQNKLIFAGYIYAFSDEEESAELLLTQVIVYNEVTGEELYQAERMYLSRKIDDLTIEFPDVPVQAQTGGRNG